MSARAVSIVYVNPSGFIGGAEKSLLDILRHLDRSRFRPSLVTLAEGPLLAEAAALDVPARATALAAGTLGISQHNPLASAGRVPAAVLDARRAVRALRELLPPAGPLILHANGLKADLVARWARPERAWVIWHFRNELRARWLRGVFRLAMDPRCVRVLANSRVTARSLPPEFEACVVYNGIEEPQPTSVASRSVAGAGTTAGQHGSGSADRIPHTLRASPDEILIGAVGHLAPGKGYETLLRAFAPLARSHSALRLVILGESVYYSSPEYGARLERLSAELGLSDRVLFAGHCEPVWPWLQQFDIFVAPSRIEGFGRAVVEAMLAGKAIVAARAGALPEIVVDGESGMLVPPLDEAAWGQAIERLIDAPNERARLGRAAAERARSHFSMESMMQSLHDVYATLGGSEPRRAPRDARPS